MSDSVSVGDPLVQLSKHTLHFFCGSAVSVFICLVLSVGRKVMLKCLRYNVYIYIFPVGI